MGKSTDNISDLKRQLRDAFGIPIEKQIAFQMKVTDKHVIVDEWKLLSYCEEPLLLILLELWQRVDLETQVIHLSLSLPCLDVFDRVLHVQLPLRLLLAHFGSPATSIFQIMGVISSVILSDWSRRRQPTRTSQRPWSLVSGRWLPG